MTGTMRILPVVATSLFLISSPALADAIDGHWCFKGKSLTIDGPKIVTPGGAKITGDYQRHGFAYVAPAGEPGAGTRITLVLEDEDTMHLSRGANSAGITPPLETWKRCDLTT